MIQRIQTIFWLISLVLLFIVLSIELKNGIAFYQNPSTLALCSAAIVLHVISIFLFQKRMIQILGSYISIVFLIGIFIILYIFEPVEWLTKYKIAIGLLISCIIMNLLGIYFTKKDIDLLDNSSRLR